MVKKKTATAAVDAATVVAALVGKFGKGAATTSGDEALGAVAGYVSTQCLALDNIIGHPGIPQSRIMSIRGRESAGKTTILTHILAECQRRGGLPVYLDSEYAFDSRHAADLGLYDAAALEERGLTGQYPLAVGNKKTENW